MRNSLHPANDLVPDPVEGLINDESDLAHALGLDSPEQIGKALFKATRCGICYGSDPEGVEVAGYAEGADAECLPRRLSFPFSLDSFDAACQEADQEGVDLWNEWNTD